MKPHFSFWKRSPKVLKIKKELYQILREKRENKTTKERGTENAMLLSRAAALGHYRGLHQKHRERRKIVVMTLVVVNFSSFFKNERDEKKKRKEEERKSDRTSTRASSSSSPSASVASSSSSFEPVVIDIGDGTNDNNGGNEGGGGGGSWFGGSEGRNNRDNNDDDESNKFNSLFKFLLIVLLFRQGVVSALGKLHEPTYVNTNTMEENDGKQQKTREQIEKRKTSDCAIVIPALNEEENIELLLVQIQALRPRPSEVVVAVGDSTDNTGKIAEKYNVKVVRGKRGRSRQMNAGVHALATNPKNIMFLHADTIPFPDILNVIDDTMKDAKAILGGFVSLITNDKKTYWGLSYHNVFKSDLYTAILYPRRYVLGLKLLFGDQGIFCRLEDFKAINGYDETLPIMEDADLCVRMQKYGCTQKNNTTSCVRLVDRVITTSARRIESMGGNLKSTFVHFLIGGAWGIFKIKGDGLVWLYERFYGWNQRGGKTKQKKRRKDY